MSKDELIAYSLYMLAVLSIIFYVVFFGIKVNSILQAKPQPNPNFTLSKQGYVIIDGDTTQYKLKKVEVYKLVKEEK